MQGERKYNGKIPVREPVGRSVLVTSQASMEPISIAKREIPSEVETELKSGLSRSVMEMMMWGRRR